MEQQIYITLDYDLATGDVNFNEIVYRLKELRDRLMLPILEQILKSYDDLIVERLKISSRGQTGELWPNLPKFSIPRQKDNVDNKTRFSYREGYCLC